MQGRKAAQFVVESFDRLLTLDVTQCDAIGRTIAIPTFEQAVVLAVCQAAREHFEKCDIVLELRAPFYIVGDIHGNIFDLIRVLTSSPPPTSRFLFLGDYVDRGEYSVECVTLLFSLMLVYPDSIFLLRGNHEFETMNANYGFADEVMAIYESKAVYDACNDTFMYMPLIGIFNSRIFCVHGGIAPRAKDMAELKKIKRPLPAYDVEHVSDLVWSDPCYDSRSFDESRRGLGVQFGERALQEFLDMAGMKMMIRAHQCVQSGISRFGNDLLYTVFSCSNYADSQGNRCGLLFLSQQLQLQMFSLPPMEQIPRRIARLERVLYTEGAVGMRAADSITLNLTMKDMSLKKKVRSRLSMVPKLRGNILQKFSSMQVSVPVRRDGPRVTAALGRSASVEYYPAHVLGPRAKTLGADPRREAGNANM